MTEIEKAIKALEAALRKAARAGVQAKVVYTYVNEHGENISHEESNVNY